MVRARREALARRGSSDGDDSYRPAGSAERQGRRLDGTGFRPAIRCVKIITGHTLGVERETNSVPAGKSLGRTLLSAVPGPAAVGNLYWAQPLLGEIATALNISLGESGTLITVT